MFSQDVYLKVLDYTTTIRKKEELESLNFLSHITAVTMEVIHACQKSSIEEEKANFAISCSLLCDVIENTSITYDDLYTNFSPEIADGVEALSRNKNEEIKDCLEKLLNQPYEIQMIKLADSIVKISNLKQNNNEKRKEYIKEASLLLSCLKNSNIYLSQRLEEKIKDK